MTRDLSKTAPSSVGSVRQRRHGLVPGGALGGVPAAVEIVEGGLVRRDQAGAGAALDAHVADGHPLLHVERADRLAAELEDVAGAAADADAGDQGEDDVLRADARAEAPVDADLVGQGLALEQRLGGEDHLDLAGPDAERQRAERPVRGRVRVAADDRHAGLGEPQLRPDDVDDALGVAAERVDRDAELGAVRLELPDLRRRLQVDDREAARRGGRAVIRGGHGLVRAPDRDAAGPEAGERLGAGDLVDEVEVDGEDGRGARVLGRRRARPRSCRRGCAVWSSLTVCSAAAARRGRVPASRLGLLGRVPAPWPGSPARRPGCRARQRPPAAPARVFSAARPCASASRPAPPRAGTGRAKGPCP